MKNVPERDCQAGVSYEGQQQLFLRSLQSASNFVGGWYYGTVSVVSLYYYCTLETSSEGHEIRNLRYL
jgi:hypothetical protein